jgi:Tfp pilus assembly protein PilO
MRFFLTILLITSLATLGFLEFPQWQEFQRLRAQQSILQSIAVNANEVIDTRNQLLSRYNAISLGDQARLDALLPSAVSEETLLDLLQELSIRHGLLLKTISVRKTEIKNPLVIISQSKPYDEVIFEISVAGTYQSFRGFLASVEQNARLVEVDSITFSAGEADSFEFSIHARTRFLGS